MSAPVLRLSGERACTYSYLCGSFNRGYRVSLSSERVLNMVLYSHSYSSSLDVSAPFAAEQLGNPTLSGVQTMPISPKLAIKTLTAVCPKHRERKTPDVGGLKCVSRRFEMTLSQTPNKTCWPAGWRLRMTHATSSTGVKGGLQNKAGNGATPKYHLPSRGGRGRRADAAISWASEW